MVTRGEVSVFVVATLLAGGVAGAAVPIAYFLFFAIASGSFDFGVMLGLLNIVALGGAIGFVLGCSAALGASLLGVWVRGLRWGPTRLARFAAPFVGAYIMQVWAPLVLPGFPWLYALILIPSATVALTANVRWSGGFMNPRAVVLVGEESSPSTESAAAIARRSTPRFPRGWPKVAVVCGSSVLVAAWLLVTVAVAPSAPTVGSDRGASITVIVGLGVIAVVVGFLWARPLRSPGSTTLSEAAHDGAIAGEQGTP